PRAARRYGHLSGLERVRSDQCSYAVLDRAGWRDRSFQRGLGEGRLRRDQPKNGGGEKHSCRVRVQAWGRRARLPPGLKLEELIPRSRVRTDTACKSALGARFPVKLQAASLRQKKDFNRKRRKERLQRPQKSRSRTPLYGWKYIRCLLDGCNFRSVSFSDRLRRFWNLGPRRRRSAGDKRALINNHQSS